MHVATSVITEPSTTRRRAARLEAGRAPRPNLHPLPLPPLFPWLSRAKCATRAPPSAYPRPLSAQGAHDGPWGRALAFWKQEVVRYLGDAAATWLGEYRGDGLRFDSGNDLPREVRGRALLGAVGATLSGEGRAGVGTGGLRFDSGNDLDGGLRDRCGEGRAGCAWTARATYQPREVRGRVLLGPLRG